MREATNNYNGSQRILVRFPVLADRAADFQQRPRAQATLSPGRKYDPERLESAPDLPRRQRARAPPLHLEIVDCPPADEAADASFAPDQPSKARAERHWVVADIAALGAPSRMRAVIAQSRRHSTAISASSRGIWRTCAPLVTFREPYLPSRVVTRADRGAGNNAGPTAVTRAVTFMKS
jgi:hypothetical protein